MEDEDHRVMDERIWEETNILGPGQCPRPGQIWAELSRFLARDNFFLSGTCPGQEFLLAHQPCVRSFQRKSIAFCQSGPAWWGRPGNRDVPAHRDVPGVRDNCPGRPGQLCAGVSRSEGSKPGFCRKVSFCNTGFIISLCFLAPNPTFGGWVLS